MKGRNLIKTREQWGRIIDLYYDTPYPIKDVNRYEKERKKVTEYTNKAVDYIKRKEPWIETIAYSNMNRLCHLPLSEISGNDILNSLLEIMNKRGKNSRKIRKALKQEIKL